MAADLTIDFASSLQLRLSGTVTGTAGAVDLDGDTVDDLTDVLLSFDPVYVAGTAGFALTMSTVDADTDGNGVADLLGATLTGLALDVTSAGVGIKDVAKLTVSGKLALATLKPANVADTRSWFALKMGEVTVSGELLLDAGFDAGVDLTIGALDYNSATNPTNPALAKRAENPKKPAQS